MPASARVPPVVKDAKGMKYGHTQAMISPLRTEYHLISAALTLGAQTVVGWSREESVLAKNVAPYAEDAARRLQKQIKDGADPMGEAFCYVRSAETRRDQGATYTPPFVANAMVSWAVAKKFSPARVVDPGVGSARFLIAAAKSFPKATLVGIEIDPLAAIISRANLAAAGLAHRSEIILGDYRNVALPMIDGRTLFIGNPPYVRHHQLDAKGKEWANNRGEKTGFLGEPTCRTPCSFLSRNCPESPQR